MPVILRRHNVVGAARQVTIVPFPDLPGWVVQVHRVMIGFVGFGAASAIGNVLDHNVSLAITIDMIDSTSMWCRIDSAFGNNPNQAPNLMVYTPVPYELIGPQRWVTVNSVGTIDVFLTVLYEMRREANKTKWNALRAKTSFERG